MQPKLIAVGGKATIICQCCAWLSKSLIRPLSSPHSCMLRAIWLCGVQNETNSLWTSLMRRTTWSYTWVRKEEGRLEVRKVCSELRGCSMNDKCVVSFLLYFRIFNRPGVAGAVLKAHVRLRSSRTSRQIQALSSYRQFSDQFEFGKLVGTVPHPRRPSRPMCNHVG